MAQCRPVLCYTIEDIWSIANLLSFKNDESPISPHEPFSQWYTEFTASSLFSSLFTAQQLTERTYNSQLTLENSHATCYFVTSWLSHAACTCSITLFGSDCMRHKLRGVGSLKTFVHSHYQYNYSQAVRQWELRKSSTRDFPNYFTLKHWSKHQG